MLAFFFVSFRDSPMNCPFTLNADNLWQCPQCGWVYPRASDKPPRRNCPKAPDAPPKLTRREQLLHRNAIVNDPPRDELERRLDICEACEEYEGYGCITMGSACRKADRWQERVLLGSCKHHSLQDGGGENGH